MQCVWQPYDGVVEKNKYHREHFSESVEERESELESGRWEETREMASGRDEQRTRRGKAEGGSRALGAKGLIAAIRV